MSYGFEEIRTTRMVPGPDGKLVPHVHVERREFTSEEAQEVMKEHERMFSGFNEFGTAVDGLFGSLEDTFKKFGDGFKKFHERYCQGKVGPRD